MGQKLTAFGYTAPAVRGAGYLPAPFPLPRDSAQEKILRSKEALYGRTTYYTGPTPSYISTYPGSGLTPERIQNIHNQVLVVGWMLDKACLDEQVILRDGQIRAIDTSRRVASVGKPLSIEPANGSELARHIADYQQAVIDDIDDFSASMQRLLFANAAGYALEEVVYENKPIRFPIGKDKTILIEGIHPKQLEWVTNKCTRFDVNTDELLLDMGAGQFVAPPDQKFLVHTASADFQIRRRGYMYQAIWYHLIKHSAIARWAVVLDIWGIPVPYGIASEALWQDEKRQVQMVETVKNLGLGKPAVFTDEFRMEASPNIMSQGDARGMHAALIGWANTELAKLIQGETLTTEIGGVGSYNASETHAAVKESIVAMDARDLSNTVRKTLLRQNLILNMDALCAAFGASPDEILRNNGWPYWRIEREITTKDRMDLYIKATNDLGLNIDQDQAYQEFGFKKARLPQNAIPGKAQILSADSISVSNQVATDGMENLKATELSADSSSSKNEISQNP